MKQGSRRTVLLLCMLLAPLGAAQETDMDSQETATPDERQTTQPQQPAGEMEK